MEHQKIAVITGATAGLGRFVARGLAASGHHVVLLARDAGRGEALRTTLAQDVPGASSELVLADLSSLRQTRQAGQAIAARHGAVHVLVNNAALVTRNRQITPEGRERILAVNHLAPFVLTAALEQALQQGAPARVVNVGSTASDRARLRLDDLEGQRGFHPLTAYGRSKLALMMATFEWSRRWAGTRVAANVVHPGVVATDILALPGPIGWGWRLMRPFMITPEQGSDTPLFVALSPTLEDVTGQYFKRRKPARPNRQALSGEATRRLWAETERLAG